MIPNNMKKVLITGGSGFIGCHLANYISDFNVELTIADNLSRGKMDDEFNNLVRKTNVKFLQIDLTKKEMLDQLSDNYDYIYHLAAVNGTKYFYEKPQEVLRVNILALLNILDWIDMDNCGKFLFASSSEAYASTVKRFSRYEEFIPTNEDIPLSVDDIFNARYSYGGSKLIGELLTVNYCRTKKIPFIIVRYHNIYGPRMGYEHVIPEFCRRIYDCEKPFRIFGGEETRAFCYADDCIKATKLVMESEACNGEVVNIGNSSEEIKIADLLKKLFDITGYMAPLEIIPAPEGSVQRRCPDTSKLQRLTGYKAETGLDAGVK
jgi:nucleoside-diphosphate-sugar epimerase